MTGRLTFVVAVSVGLVSAAFAAERDIQVRSVNFETRVVELFNFGATNQSLNGFQTCTQDENQIARYSGFAGFNGVTIESGTSLFIHYANDAPSGDPDRINRSTLGGFFAVPLDQTAYAFSLYFPPVNFLNGATMADHVQWNVNGENDLIADFRSDEAVAGGVWTGVSDWVATTTCTTEIVLNDASGAILHGPDDYTVVEPGCAADLAVAGGDADLDGDCSVNITDLGIVLAAFGSGGATHAEGDTNGDGSVNITDLGNVLAKFGAVCTP